MTEDSQNRVRGYGPFPEGAEPTEQIAAQVAGTRPGDEAAEPQAQQLDHGEADSGPPAQPSPSPTGIYESEAGPWVASPQPQSGQPTSTTPSPVDFPSNPGTWISSVDPHGDSPAQTSGAQPYGEPPASAAQRHSESPTSGDQPYSELPASGGESELPASGGPSELPASGGPSELPASGGPSEIPASGGQQYSEPPASVGQQYSEPPASGRQRETPTSGAQPFSETPTSGAHPHSGAPTSGAHPYSGAPTSGAHPYSGGPTSGAHPYGETPTSGADPYAPTSPPYGGPQTSNTPYGPFRNDPDQYGFSTPPGRRIEPSPPRKRNRLLIGLAAGLTAGLLIFGTAGWLTGRATAPDNTAAQNTPTSSLGVFERTQVTINSADFRGTGLAVLAKGWLPYVATCNRSGTPGGPALNEGEKARVRCTLDGMSAIFVEYKSAAERDKARGKTLSQAVDARALTPGVAAAAERTTPSGRTTGNYVEYAYRLTERGTTRTVSGLWWDDEKTPVAGYLLAYWREGVGESWEPVRDLWSRYA